MNLFKVQTVYVLSTWVICEVVLYKSKLLGWVLGRCNINDAKSTYQFFCGNL